MTLHPDEIPNLKPEKGLVRKCSGDCTFFHNGPKKVYCSHEGDETVQEGDVCKYDLLAFGVSRPYGGKDWD